MCVSISGLLLYVLYYQKIRLNQYTDFVRVLLQIFIFTLITPHERKGYGKEQMAGKETRQTEWKGKRNEMGSVELGEGIANSKVAETKKEGEGNRKRG